MEKTQSKMCRSCIYRIGELHRNREEHSCHEHTIGGISDETIAFAGSCSSLEKILVYSPPPNDQSFKKINAAEFINTVVRNLFQKSCGVKKMDENTKVSNYHKNLNNQ